VIIVDFQKGYTLSTGISAGIGNEPVTTKGIVGPGIDITLGASSINSILSSLNGSGFINLGKVTPDFYVSLKLLEDQGIMKVRSTHKLSTLNGHEALMKISKTEYYLEETSQIFANASTTQTKIKQYKPVNADFSITITPIVSADEQITMQVKVDQSDFTGGKIANDAPPNQISRSFTSLIRVRNEDMILLGGLEEGIMKDTGSGFPVLSRIPVLKWIFSSRDRIKNEKRLSIFIKPTIIY
jgi:type IV pilus assembly protein PilQ